MPSWFRALTGFEERDYADTQSRLRVVGDRLHSLVNEDSHCGAHSPTKERPGPQGAAFSEAFAALGYAVGTTATAVQSYPRLLEVYPHKQSKSKAYKVTPDRWAITV
ncbi:MAG: hypothetical protein NT064_04965 [Proteobacteria bacterium]|nr:hypothetical protein [Pseudomonadota bacterium]